VRSAVEKIAISLPRDLLLAIEKARKEKGLSRSAMIRLALEESLARQRRAELVERYVESYRRRPESKAEIEAARSAAAELLAEEPWE
jgi:hypothetical protein